MPIDPLAKLAAQRKRTLQRGLKPIKRPRKRGKLTSAEIATVALVVKDAPLNTPDARAIDLTARLLQRDENTIRSAIQQARAKLQARATEYVDLHFESAKQALKDGEPDVARKASEWAISNISATDSAGKSERIIEKPTSGSDMPVIQIGVALGGLPHGRLGQ